MASSIRIRRICESCGNEFITKTTVTRCCSDACAKRAYKARKRAEKMQASDEETKAAIEKPIIELQSKDFLSVTEFCELFKCSRATVWRMCKDGRLKSVQIGKHKYISRAAINKLFEP